MNKQLTQKQKKFAENYILRSMSIAESVRRSGYAVKSGRSEDYGSLGCRLLKTERVSHYVSKLRDKAFEKDLLTFNERRSFLAKVVRSSPSEVDANSDICQEYSETTNEHGVSKRVKIPDKLKALELDAKLAGDFNKENEVTNPFLFLVNFFTPNSSPLTLPNPNVIDAEIVP